MCPYIPTYVLQTQYFGCIYHTFDLLGITNQRQKNRQKNNENLSWGKKNTKE